MSERGRHRFRYQRERELREQPAAAAEPGADVDAEVARRRMDQQARWVDLQVRAAIERGDFDDLPGAGKPIEGLSRDGTHDPDWWVKKLIVREQVTGVLPPALALRKEDAELSEALDREPTADAVRRVVEEFNRRVVEARRQLTGGPPVVTPLRDVELEVAGWEERRRARWARRAVTPPDEDPAGRRHWWQIRRRRA